ncbi:MAG TPA: UDP-glucose--hexose-1-phosphate uridylyltransferase [Candidatus Limnocylindrales bacterium]|jgi:UDPglucose--hexose-1-phosphate uridylyltransferase|nr:UDP-glucose--hexose-1-phosphate uridylyltransferase [Candidatus Limnocylindrales bacterium]
MIDLSKIREVPHRRFNPLTREWVLVSPHRTQRPWQGQTERQPEEREFRFDPHCYLCPGNERAGGVRNPQYDSTFVFDNDFAALKPDVPNDDVSDGAQGLLVAQTETGVCRVLCFSPRHDMTLAQMDVSSIRRVVDLWTDQYRELGAMREINHVQIFENRGEMMGCSNPHPHGQVWADQTIPNVPRLEQESLTEYRHRNGSCLLCDYVELERAAGERIVCENEHFLALVPFWAVWPFEILLCSKSHVADLCGLDDRARTALADLLKRITTRYDNLFEAPFPYTMGFHQQPTDGVEHPEWHLHAHFFPPLLRSATVRKFMVGYELLATPQRDITAESAAERLRNLPEQHYRNGNAHAGD